MPNVLDANSNLHEILGKIRDWADKPETTTELELPSFVSDELKALRGLVELVMKCSPHGFESVVTGYIRDRRQHYLASLSVSRQREASQRFPIDVDLLLPNAYHAWSQPLRDGLLARLGCEKSSPLEEKAYEKLFDELEDWDEQLRKWRERVEKEPLRAFPKPSLEAQLEENRIAVELILETDPARQASLKRDVAKKAEAELAKQASLRRDVAKKEECQAQELLDGNKLLSDLLEQIKEVPQIDLLKSRASDLVSLLFRHPRSPEGQKGWEDLLEEIIEDTRRLRDELGSAVTLYSKMSTLTGIPKAAVDLMVEAIGAFVKGCLKTDKVSTIRSSTVTLYWLLSLVFRPKHDRASIENLDDPCSKGCVSLDDGPRDAHDDVTGMHPLPPRASWAARPQARVTIIGGGIAGLSAAHELVERGFDVQVVEQRVELTPGGPLLALGGVARTQWAVVANKEQPEARMERAWPIAGLGSYTIAFDQDQFSPSSMAEFFRDCLTLVSDMLYHWKSKESCPPLTLEIRGHTCHLCEEDKREKEKHEKDKRNKDEPEKEETLAAKRARYCWAALAGLTRPYKDTPARVRVREAKLVDCGTRRPRVFHAHEHDPAKCKNRRVEIVLVPDPAENACFVPGEHGYRFFPSFYRHLRDTMRRTPLYDDRGRETALTVADNLVPTYTQVFASPGRLLEFSRTRPRTLEEFRSQLKLALADLKFGRRDLQRFAARIFRYLATGRARREATYEDISWWDFLTLKEIDPRWHGHPDAPRHAYGAEFERQLKAAPQALVAMDAEFCDARTQGNIVLQLLLDQFLGNETTDSTLNGPTTEAWFNHWRRHLRAMGVRFYEGELDCFATERNGTELRACWAPGRVGVRWPLPVSEISQGYDEAVDYYVLAVDVVAAESVTRLLRPRPGEEGFAADRPDVSAGGAIFDLREYCTYIPSRRDLRLRRARRDPSRRPILRDDDRLERITDAWAELYERHEDLPLWKEHPSWSITRTGTFREPGAPVYGRNATDRLQTFSGVQFYFRDDFQIARGHAYFQETAWGLSAISQMQFWRHKQVFRQDGIRGLLSVDVGSFSAPSAYLRQPAHLAEEPQFAAEVWRQVRESLRRTHEQRMPQDRPVLPVPEPFAYHVDEWLQFGGGDGVSTSTPFLVNNVGDWISRPGAEPWDPSFPRQTPRRDETPKVWQSSHGGYQVHFDKLVFAGSYTKTFTRMTTMEAANESARHAVNAILDHINSPDGRKNLLRRMNEAALAAAKKAAAAAAAAAAKAAAKPKDAPTTSQSAPEAAEPEPATDATTTNPSASDAAAREPAPAPTPSDLLKEFEDAVAREMKRTLTRVDAAMIAGDYCKIWDPERHELEDFEFLRRVDDMLFEAGKPHMFDILGVDELVDRASPESDPLEALLTAVCTTVQRDWDLGGVKDGGGLRLVRELGERLRQAFAGLQGKRA